MELETVSPPISIQTNPKTSENKTPPANSNPRHNQECEYTLAKKQQASKKSLGSGPPKNTQSLMDDCSREANWNFDLDPEGILLPVGDTKNVFDFSKFSWPIPPLNDDYSFDFDVPFTADGLDTASGENLASAPKNDCPLLLNQSSQPIDLTESPGDLAKMLDLNDKKCEIPKACFEQPLGVPNFLNRSYFDKYMKDARGQPQGNSVLISLIDSVMAFGFHALLKSSRRFVSPGEKKEADCYSRIALSSQASVLRSPDTLFKLQTLLAMTTISEPISKTTHSEILAGAINCARVLKLENSDMIHSNYKSHEERDLAKRALWFLYSIEVPYSLRRGISSSLKRDWIDLAPPQASNETDWFPIQCLYSLVIDSAASFLYSQKGLRQSAAEREHNLDLAFRLLEDWRNHLPPALKEIHKAENQGTQSKGRMSEEARKKGTALCVNSAQVVLTTANQVSCLEILDSKLLDLISVSLCMTFLDLASKSGTQKSIAYLSMGCGIFGRLHLEHEVPLVDVLELTQIAQQIKGR
ncbi:integral membrane protein duf6 [Phlyctema vagabunda]|uniref:Integral membrane protein duf6 n=1 Tax=Phlyctema vagabunda TaxID=108571 RepID=A0ABR4P1B5_9HELO